MACARDGFPNAQIHSLETNGTRIDAPIRQPMYSTSLFSAVPKRLVTITCSILTTGGIVAKKPQDAQNNQHSKHAKRGQQQKRGDKAQAAAPTPPGRIPRLRPPVPGARAAISSSPSVAPTWMRAAGTSATLSTSAATPTWTIPALAWPSSAAYSTRTATRWASSANPTGPIPPASPCSASRAWAFWSVPAIWTPWSTTIR